MIAGLFSKVIPFISGIFGGGTKVKKLLNKAHKGALKAGVELARDASQGKNIWKSAKQKWGRAKRSIIDNYKEEIHPELMMRSKSLGTRMKARASRYFNRARGRARRWASKYSLDDMFD